MSRSGRVRTRCHAVGIEGEEGEFLRADCAFGVTRAGMSGEVTQAKCLARIPNKFPIARRSDRRWIANSAKRESMPKSKPRDIMKHIHKTWHVVVPPPPRRRITFKSVSLTAQSRSK